jgi:hypothetical protein
MEIKKIVENTFVFPSLDNWYAVKSASLVYNKDSERVLELYGWHIRTESGWPVAHITHEGNVVYYGKSSKGKKTGINYGISDEAALKVAQYAWMRMEVEKKLSSEDSARNMVRKIISESPWAIPSGGGGIRIANLSALGRLDRMRQKGLMKKFEPLSRVLGYKDIRAVRGKLGRWLGWIFYSKNNRYIGSMSSDGRLNFFSKKKQKSFYSDITYDPNSEESIKGAIVWLYLNRQKWVGLTEGAYPESAKRKKLLVLVGPPSVGKSTWIRSNYPSAYVISRDDIVDEVSSSAGWTYDDMFVNPPAGAVIGDRDDKYGEVVEAPFWMPWAKTAFDRVLMANEEVKRLFNSRVAGAHSSGKDIVVDMTNMSANSRKNAMKAIEGNEGEYFKIAVNFKFEGDEETIKKVAEKRAQAAKRMGKSKTIPPEAFDKMFKSYEKPSKEEGFDEIIDYDNIEGLKKAMLS